MLALRDLLNPSRITAIVDVGGADLQGNPPYQRMLDEGVCTVETMGWDVSLADGTYTNPIDLLKVTGDPFPMEIMRVGKNKVAAHIPASFFPQYSFGLLDYELRGMGLILHCFADCHITSIISAGTIPQPDPHQIAQADLFYVKDFSKPMDVEQWKHLAMLAHHVCGSYDLAMHAVSELAKAGAIPEDGAAQYQRILERL